MVNVPDMSLTIETVGFCTGSGGVCCVCCVCCGGCGIVKWNGMIPIRPLPSSTAMGACNATPGGALAATEKVICAVFASPGPKVTVTGGQETPAGRDCGLSF